MIREETKRAIENLYGADLEKLRHQELSPLGFDFAPIAEKIRKLVEDFKKILDHVGVLRMTNATDVRLGGIAERVWSQVITPALNFIVKDNPSASTQYQAINSALESLSEEFIGTASELLLQIEVNEISPRQVKSDRQEVLKLKKESAELIESLKKKNEEADRIINQTRQASGITAAKVSGNNFEVQAGEHEEFAQRWLYAVCGLTVLVLVLILSLFHGWRPFSAFKIVVGMNKYELVHAVVFKLLLLSLAYFGLHQSVKNYKAHRHLYIMNKHRHNALSVYPTMLSAGESPEIRSVITTQAARSVFEPTQSGYLGSDDDPRPVNPTEIVTKIIDRKE